MVASDLVHGRGDGNEMADIGFAQLPCALQDGCAFDQNSFEMWCSLHAPKHLRQETLAVANPGKSVEKTRVSSLTRRTRRKPARFSPGDFKNAGNRTDLEDGDENGAGRADGDSGKGRDRDSAYAMSEPSHVDDASKVRKTASICLEDGDGGNPTNRPVFDRTVYESEASLAYLDDPTRRRLDLDLIRSDSQNKYPYAASASRENLNDGAAGTLSASKQFRRKARNPLKRTLGFHVCDDGAAPAKQRQTYQGRSVGHGRIKDGDESQKHRSDLNQSQGAGDSDASLFILETENRDSSNATVVASTNLKSGWFSNQRPHVPKQESSSSRPAVRFPKPPSLNELGL